MKSLLFKPFEKFSENKLLVVGFCASVIAPFIAYVFNVRFDGIMDLHFASDVQLQQALIDNLIDIACLVMFLFLGAKFINKKTRFVDILTTSMIARIPYYLLPLININGAMTMASENILKSFGVGSVNEISFSGISILLVFAIITILFLVWYVALLFTGYKVASNAKGTIAIIVFCVALLFAEILSKTLIFYLN